MSKARVLLVSLACLGWLAQTGMAAQMRSRAEAVPGMQASNTVGLGDIWVTGGLSSYFRIRPVANDMLAKQVDTVYRDDFRQLYGSGNRLQRELVMVPEVGSTMRLIIRRDVVFPQPEGPTNTVMAPLSMDMLNPSTAGCPP